MSTVECVRVNACKRLECKVTENAFGDEDNLDGRSGCCWIMSIHRSVDVKAATLRRDVRYVYIIVIVVGRRLAGAA